MPHGNTILRAVEIVGFNRGGKCRSHPQTINILRAAATQSRFVDTPTVATGPGRIVAIVHLIKRGSISPLKAKRRCLQASSHWSAASNPSNLSQHWSQIENKQIFLARGNARQVSTLRHTKPFSIRKVPTRTSAIRVQVIAKQFPICTAEPTGSLPDPSGRARQHSIASDGQVVSTRESALVANSSASASDHCIPEERI